MTNEKELEYTEEVIEQIRNLVPNYEGCGMFLHCKTCIPSKVPKGVSPREFSSYEIATYKAKIGEFNVGFITIWCKHCNKLVWDSRHLKHAY